MKRYLTYIGLLSVFIVSCQKILFNGDETTRKIPLEDFHAVRISGIFNIVLTQDTENRLEITGSNDINTINAVVVNDTLIIDTHKKMSLNPAKNTLSLHFKNLKHLVTYDPVNVTNTDTIKSEDFRYAALGEISEVSLTIESNYLLVMTSANTLGYFHIYGKTNICSFYNRYGSVIFAGSLICSNAEITNESIGDVYINASEKITVSICGPGNVYYYGNPVIEIAENRGTGRIMRAYK
jgi:hypothetical protein